MIHSDERIGFRMRRLKWRWNHLGFGQYSRCLILIKGNPHILTASIQL